MSFFEEAKISPELRTFIAKDLQTIEGYLSEDESALFALVHESQKANGIAGDIAEFGVWRGRSALMLYQLLASDERLHAVDIFDLRDRAHPFFNDPAIFLGHCERLNASERMNVLKVDTTTAGAEMQTQIASDSCRIVHVDGGHSYEVAKVDIDSAFRAVSLGGIVVCDDILARKFPGVTQAFVEASLQHPDFVPFALSKKKVWVANRRYAETYRQWIRDQTGLKFRSSTFMGGKMLLI